MKRSTARLILHRLQENIEMDFMAYGENEIINIILEAEKEDKEFISNGYEPEKLRYRLCPCCENYTDYRNVLCTMCFENKINEGMTSTEIKEKYSKEEVIECDSDGEILETTKASMKKKFEVEIHLKQWTKIEVLAENEEEAEKEAEDMYQNADLTFDGDAEFFATEIE